VGKKSGAALAVGVKPVVGVKPSLSVAKPATLHNKPITNNATVHNTSPVRRNYRPVKHRSRPLMQNNQLATHRAAMPQNKVATAATLHNQVTAPATPQGQVTTPATQTGQSFTQNWSPSLKDSSSILPEQPIWTKATALAIPSLHLLPGKKLSVSLKRADTLHKKAIAQVQSPKIGKDDKQREWHKLFVKGGLSADEVLYMNATAMAGIKYVYGIVSYGTNFSVNRFRFGVGIPIRLNNEQQLHFSATMGVLNKSRLSDTVAISSDVKEKLYRFATAWSKTYNQKWTLQLQVHYNVLQKTFSSDQTYSGDYHFYYASAPYMLVKNENKHSDTAGWIGAQISVFYSLF
jgi:hypothetical protein